MPESSCREAGAFRCRVSVAYEYRHAAAIEQLGFLVVDDGEALELQPVGDEKPLTDEQMAKLLQDVIRGIDETLATLRSMN